MAELTENKEKLPHIAVNLFAAPGSCGISIRDIARRMGMNISDFHRYLGNKLWLLITILPLILGLCFTLSGLGKMIEAWVVKENYIR